MRTSGHPSLCLRTCPHSRETVCSPVQEVRREKMLVERLMKQCQQERRIATQLMHIRKEKDTIRNNRILRQQQYSEQRELEYQQALDREAVSD